MNNNELSAAIEETLGKYALWAGDIGMLVTPESEYKLTTKEIMALLPQWTPVSEGLPDASPNFEQPTFLLIIEPKNSSPSFVCTAVWDGDYFVGWKTLKEICLVTHWMPLDSLPEVK